MTCRTELGYMFQEWSSRILIKRG